MMEDTPQNDEIVIKDRIENVEQQPQRLERQKFWRLRTDDGTPNYILLVGMVIAFLVVIWGIGFVVGEIKMANSKMTKISNFWYYGRGIPETSENSIYAMLYSAIQMNLPEGENPPHHGAKIRGGTYKREKAENTTDVNNVWHSEFIVDIARLRQSYKVSVDWPLGGMTVFSNYYPEVSCLTGDEVIYEDFQCKELPARFPGEKFDMAKYLPHTEYDAEGAIKYGIRLAGGYLMVQVQTCGDKVKAREYEEEARKWLEGTEMDWEMYEMKVVETCDGGA